MKLIFDADHLVFVAAAAFEDRCVELTHKETGEKRLTTQLKTSKLLVIRPKH